MRIDDDVRLHAALREWHVDRRPFLRANTLLTVSRREFITYQGRTGNSQGDVDLLQLLISRVATCIPRNERDVRP